MREGQLTSVDDGHCSRVVRHGGNALRHSPSPHISHVLSSCVGQGIKEGEVGGMEGREEGREKGR